ncbi:MAG: hypothetical protein WAM82_07805 [Thermoanaerobaculia bacterium]
MRKTQSPAVGSSESREGRGRVLARVLAEELENVLAAAATTEGLTTVATYPDGGRKDITNWTYDNDGFDY